MVNDANEEERFVEIEKNVLELFGRERNKHLYLTLTIVMDSLKSDAGRANWIMSHMIEVEKIASVTNPRDSVVYIVRNKKGFNYTSGELVRLLNRKYFDDVGRFLKKILNQEGLIEISDEFLEEHDDKLGLPADIIERIIYCFTEAGLLEISDRKLKWPKKLRRSDVKLDYDSVKSIFLSGEFLSSDFKVVHGRRKEFSSFEDIARIYEKHNKEMLAETLNFEAKNSIGIQHISEILFGHQDLDMSFLNRLLIELEKLSKDQRPDVIVVTGLVQGAFQHRQKNRRRTLVENLKSEDSQFKAAKMFLDRLLEMGFKVIYNKGDDDQGISENRTVDALIIMHNLNKPKKDTEKRSVNYWQFDKLKQTEAWDFHYWFQCNVVFEYMLRCGRRLYSADEVYEKSNGERRIEEYLMLLETYLALSEGKHVPDDFYKTILEIKNISLPNRQFDNFMVADDFKIRTVLKGKTVEIWNIHNISLTPTAMLADPTKVARELIGQIGASGKNVPDALITEHQQQDFGCLKDNTLIVSTPGMHTANLTRKAYSSGVSIDSSRRKLTTRRELFSAGSTEISITSDKRYQAKFYAKNFLEKAGISPERITIALFSDWQIGSADFRPDLQVKVLDYILRNVLPNNPTYLFFVGDIIQGRNYKNMPNETQHVGLITIDSQQEFAKRILLNSFMYIPAKHLDNLKLVGITPGNHELNSMYDFIGSSHSLFIKEVFELVSAQKKVNIKVVYYKSMASEYGDHIKAWVGKEKIAGYGVMVQHSILGKGGAGKPPVYGAKSLFQGTGQLVKDVDVILTGHWHEPYWLVVNDKLVVVNGSMAGLSAYEWKLGLRPTMATILLHLGGGVPPVLEIMTSETLFNHKPKGFYSFGKLAKIGFVDDNGFVPERHGFNRFKNTPKSAIQKSLWALIDEIIRNASSSF